MENKTEVIKQQIGRNTLSLISAQHLLGSDNSLTIAIKIPGKRGNFKFIVSLDLDDTYNVELGNATISRKTFEVQWKVLYSVSGIYAEQLSKIIEEAYLKQSGGFIRW